LVLNNSLLHCLFCNTDFVFHLLLWHVSVREMCVPWVLYVSDG
jgi:hypothetical protein